MTAVRRAWRGSGPHIGTFAGAGNHITAADDAFVAMLGYDRARFDADRAARVPLSPPRWQAVDEAALARAAGQWGRAETYEKAFLRSDGTEQPVLVTFGLDPSDPDRWVGYAIVLSTTRHPPVGSSDPGEDVTEGRHAELIGELLRDRHRITTMLDATSDLIWSVDDGLLLRGANVAFVETVERTVGWRPTLGDHVLPPLFDDDETSTWRELYRRALAGEIFSQRYDGHGGGRRYDWHRTVISTAGSSGPPSSRATSARPSPLNRSQSSGSGCSPSPDAWDAWLAGPSIPAPARSRCRRN